MINHDNTLKFAKNQKLKINTQLFEEENELLTHAVEENPHELVHEDNEQGQNAQRIQMRILENFSNYKFIGDARLELSVNRNEGVKKSMGGTKRSFRSHVLGSDLRRKRVNKEAAVKILTNRETDFNKFQTAAAGLNNNELAQIFNSLDLSKIDLSTDDKVIKAGPRMETLRAILRHNQIMNNKFLSREKLELVRLLLDYYEARINLISDEAYATKYNSELMIDNVSSSGNYLSALEVKIANCRDMAMRLQDFRVAAKAKKAFRVEKLETAIHRKIAADAAPELYKLKEIEFIEDNFYDEENENPLHEVTRKLSKANDDELNEIRHSIADSYETATEKYYLSIRKLNWTNYRLNSITRDADQAFLNYFRSISGKNWSDDEQQELLRKALKEGNKFVNRILPGGFDQPLSADEQIELNEKMQDIIRITRGDLNVPEDVAARIKKVSNPYYKRFYSWVSKKDSVLFVHPPVASDIKDIDKGIPNLRIALSAIVYDSADKIKDAIVDNQDGTVTVRFYERESNAPTKKREVYVKVDKTLPDLVGFDNKDKASLWVRFIEKAYAAHYGAGTYEGASNELSIIMERLTFSQTDDIFKDYNLSQIYNEALDDSLSENPGEVRESMDKAVKECRKKYNTFTPSIVQVMDYATQQAYLKNEDRKYAEKYLVSTVGLNMELFSERYTEAALELAEDFKRTLESGKVIFVSSTLREDGLDNARKKVLKGRGIHMNHTYQVLDVSWFDGGKHCIILRDPYMVSGTEYNKDRKPQEKAEASSAGGSFVMELNDFMNCFNRVVG